MKGYRTLLIGAAMVTVPPLLTYLASVNWSDYVSPTAAMAISGVIMIALRVVTTTPVGGNSTTTNTVVKILLAAFALSLLFPVASRAGDIASPTLPAFPIKVPAVKAVNCTAGNCSGFYGLFTLTDYSQNVSLPGIGSSAANDLGLQGGFGYQVWSGQLLAGIQTQWGAEFVSQGVAAPGSHLTGEVTAHIGYNFFNGLTPASAQPVTAGQNPFAGLVPSTLLQNSTPYLIGGGCQRHGIMEACAGIGIETAIASSWSAAFEYKNAPTQRGQPDVSVFSLSVKKHFSL